MDRFFKYLSTPWMGSLIGLIGIVSAIYFYLKSKTVSRLAYQVEEFAVLGSSYPAFPTEVEIRFAGSPVTTVTISKVYLWNSGTTTLRANDIVDIDPLRVEVLGGGRLLKVEILKFARAVNGVEITPYPEHENAVKIYFDYLDPQDGISFTLMHSGNVGQTKCIGTMRGLPKGPINYGKLSAKSLNSIFAKFTRIVLFGSAVIGLLFIALGLTRLFSSSMLIKTPLENQIASGWSPIILGLLYIISPFFIWWKRRRRYPISLHN